MKQVYNPFLIENEYIPDAELRIFNNRIYIYGSHDLFNGNNFWFITIHIFNFINFFN